MSVCKVNVKQALNVGGQFVVGPFGDKVDWNWNEVLIGSNVLHFGYGIVGSAFQEATGLSTASYRKQHGSAKYNQTQEELLKPVLTSYDKGNIIVCNGSSMERSGQALLQDYARTHPPYIRSWEGSRIIGLLNISGEIFRRSSNYEFYNLSETQAMLPSTSENQNCVTPFLTLKYTERNFLNFLSLITKNHQLHQNLPENTTPSESGCPLSDVSIELRKYTYAVKVPFSALLSEDTDIEGSEVGVDVFEITVDHEEVPDFDFQYQDISTEKLARISRSVSKVRRGALVPIIYHVITLGHYNASSLYLEHLGLFEPTLTNVIPESLKVKVDLAEQAKRTPDLPLITARDATKALCTSFILDPMQFYIIGASSGYSLSTKMHNTAYEALGMPHNFQALQTWTLNSLKALVSNLCFGGAAVSLPFKIEVISMTESISLQASAIDAVNTIVPVRHLKEDGSIPGNLELLHERHRAGPVKNMAIFNHTISNAEKVVTHFMSLVNTSSNTRLLPSIIHQGQPPAFRILTSRDEAYGRKTSAPQL
ncbi:hypothetical protein GQ43DRAFT_436211 [Delitschia confertaspora ATCC 74209]|uniref:Shikimate dehydrogenase substrate binding N-terminal domain-containing protein n=1 Tax=Delitschia confertaspora ATCC 74209 TaxID=1513339 RepID=A0A9P4MTK2_9PLEO|nr:hypothetical protein GQ43DRAFT_436211 [Delitschia confertaspora ATCC 74209]